MGVQTVTSPKSSGSGERKRQDCGGGRKLAAFRYACRRQGGTVGLPYAYELCRIDDREYRKRALAVAVGQCRRVV